MKNTLKKTFKVFALFRGSSISLSPEGKFQSHYKSIVLMQKGFTKHACRVSKSELLERKRKIKAKSIDLHLCESSSEYSVVLRNGEALISVPPMVKMLHSTNFGTTASIVDSDDCNNVDSESFTHFKFQVFDLAEKLSKIIYAAPKESLRHNISGAQIEIVDNELFCIATDGFRMVSPSCNLPSPQIAAAIPREAVESIVRLKNIIGEPISIKVTKCEHDYASIEWDDYVLFCELIPNYPNWRKHAYGQLNDQDRHIIQVDRLQLISILVNIPKINGMDTERPITISFKHGKSTQEIAVLYEISKLSRYSGEIPALWLTNDHDADTLLIANLRSSYLLDALESMESKKVKFMLSNGKENIVITDDDKTFHLIMQLISD